MFSTGCQEPSDIILNHCSLIQRLLQSHTNSFSVSGLLVCHFNESIIRGHVDRIILDT